VYNADGYFEKNPQNAHSVNNLTAKLTVRFGGDPAESN
jgi:hypothetical protein